MIDLFFARHGITIWNEQKRIQGQGNSALSDAGLQGACELRDFIKSHGYSFEACFCSPLPRALHTAYICVPKDTPIILEPKLIEMNLGLWEGLPREMAQATGNETYEFFMTAPDKYVPQKDAESFQSVYLRTQALLDQLKKYDNRGPILLITHHILVQTLLCVIENRPLSTLRNTPHIDQAKLFHMQYDYSTKKSELILANGKAVNL